MTAPVSRERIAQIREMHRPRGVTPGDFLAVPDTRADIADLLAAAEWGWDEHDRAERLAEEVARWESGRRVKVLPVLPEQPDALHLAAELVRKQTGEYEDTDAAMRAGAAALRDVDQTARAARADLAALVADLRALHFRTNGYSNGDDFDCCATCFDGDEQPEPWPCPTVALLDRHSAGYLDGLEHAEGIANPTTTTEADV